MNVFCKVFMLMVLLLVNLTSFGQSTTEELKTYKLDKQVYLQGSENSPMVYISADFSNKTLLENELWEEEVPYNQPKIKFKDLFNNSYLESCITCLSLMMIMKHVNLQEIDPNWSFICKREDVFLVDSLSNSFNGNFKEWEQWTGYGAWPGFKIEYTEDNSNLKIRIMKIETRQNEETFELYRHEELLEEQNMNIAVILGILNHGLYKAIH